MIPYSVCTYVSVYISCAYFYCYFCVLFNYLPDTVNIGTVHNVFVIYYNKIYIALIRIGYFAYICSHV